MTGLTRRGFLGWLAKGAAIAALPVVAIKKRFRPSNELIALGADGMTINHCLSDAQVEIFAARLFKYAQENNQPIDCFAMSYWHDPSGKTSPMEPWFDSNGNRR